MSTQGLINELRSMGVVLSAVGDRLHINAPKGIITPGLKGRLFESKPALMEVLAGSVVTPAGGKLQRYSISVRGKKITVLERSGKPRSEALAGFKERFGDSLDRAV